MFGQVEWIREAANYGLPMVILAVVGFAVWHVLAFLSAKLFDDKAGLVTRWFDKQIQLMDTLERIGHEQAGLLQKQSEAIDNLADSIGRVSEVQGKILAEMEKQRKT